MDPRSIRALDVLLDQVRLERGQQLQHFDALDGKAGVLLGFAGALIALAPVGFRSLVDLGRLLALVSGSFALATFWPRQIPVTDLLALRQHYLASDEDAAKLALLDVQVEMATRSRPLLRAKSRRLQISMSCLGLASLLTAIGVGVR